MTQLWDMVEGRILLAIYFFTAINPQLSSAPLKNWFCDGFGSSNFIFILFNSSGKSQVFHVNMFSGCSFFSPFYLTAVLLPGGHELMHAAGSVAITTILIYGQHLHVSAGFSGILVNYAK